MCGSGVNAYGCGVHENVLGSVVWCVHLCAIRGVCGLWSRMCVVHAGVCGVCKVCVGGLREKRKNSSSLSLPRIA